MSKPTVHDIAREAGVSLATVDRVLNARPGVRLRTVEKVQAAIRAIGYVRDLSAANLARQRQYRFAFVLPNSDGLFVRSLQDALSEAQAALAADRLAVEVFPVSAHDPHAVAKSLDAVALAEFDGVAIMAPETPNVRDAITHLKSRGLQVVALVSDQPNSERDHFVGINNIAAGRTAALLMGRFIRAPKAEVLVIAGSMLARDNLERRFGFDAVMAEQFGSLRVLPSVEARDDPERMAEVVRAALAAHPAIAGVYLAGSGNRALLQTLREDGRLGDLVVITHELTKVTRQALIDGEVDAVITQDVGHLVRSACRVLRAKCDGTAIIPSQERIRVEIVLKENLQAEDA